MTKARSVQAEFTSDGPLATARGGAVLVAQGLRSLGMRKLLDTHLPARSAGAAYTSGQVGTQVIAGCMLGGRGFHSAEIVRADAGLAALLGHGAVAEEATVWRALNEMAGLEPRTMAQAYAPAPARPAQIDMLGGGKKACAMRRIVPPEPEAMAAGCRAKFDAALAAQARRAARAIPRQRMLAWGMMPVFLDGTRLEVKGSCFDAARGDYKNEKSLLAMALYAGPVLAAVRVLDGSQSEAGWMPAMMGLAEGTVRELAGARPVLALADSAADAGVIAAARARGWRLLAGANKLRRSLEPLAQELPASCWSPLQPAEGNAREEAGVFVHSWPGLEGQVTVAVRRWQSAGELGLWRYSFLFTSLEPRDLPAEKLRKHGYAGALWMLYATKQGWENNFKTLLSDLGGHNPPSGRLGATEAFVFLAAMASNVWAALSLKAAPAQLRGMRLWRYARDWAVMAGTLVMESGRRLVVRLAGAGLDALKQRLFLEWMQGAARL